MNSVHSRKKSILVSKIHAMSIILGCITCFNQTRSPLHITGISKQFFIGCVEGAQFTLKVLVKSSNPEPIISGLPHKSRINIPGDFRRFWQIFPREITTKHTWNIIESVNTFPTNVPLLYPLKTSARFLILSRV